MGGTQMILIEGNITPMIEKVSHVWDAWGLANHNPLVHDGHGIYYLGSGYWRSKVVENDSQQVGLCLINPDKTKDEIDTVEKALAIIFGHQFVNGDGRIIVMPQYPDWRKE